MYSALGVHLFFVAPNLFPIAIKKDGPDKQQTIFSYNLKS